MVGDKAKPKSKGKTYKELQEQNDQFRGDIIRQNRIIALLVANYADGLAKLNLSDISFAEGKKKMTTETGIFGGMEYHIKVSGYKPGKDVF